MTSIRIETPIDAPIDVCFDLARSIDLHLESTAQTGERAVAGVTSGLIGLGQSVTWEANHLGVRQSMTVRVTEFERPHRFVDEMVRGPFKSMRHVHEFARIDGGQTLMTDVFEYEVPLGVIGEIVDRLFLSDYMRRFLDDRLDVVRLAAEAFRQPASYAKLAEANR